MRAVIAVLAGDGIGPEVTAEAVCVLRAIAERFEHEFVFREAPVGGAGIDASGKPLPDETLALCKESDAVFLGAIGGPKWDHVDRAIRPEQGLLALRQELDVFANLRPVRTFVGMEEHCPVRPEIARGTDIMIVRELTGGVYFGKRDRGSDWATDECRYSVGEIERIAEIAFRLAEQRKQRVVSVDKANVLETSRLWRETVTQFQKEKYPHIELTHQLIDSTAMQIITDPARFDVVLTENMFGDILSDEASVLAGSLGMLGSASLGANGPGIFEPVHGSAPDIAGKQLANPIGAIVTVAMLLRDGLGLSEEALAVEAAIQHVVQQNVLTKDCGGSASTSEVGSAVVEQLQLVVAK